MSVFASRLCSADQHSWQISELCNYQPFMADISTGHLQKQYSDRRPPTQNLASQISLSFPNGQRGFTCMPARSASPSRLGRLTIGSGPDPGS